MVREIYFFVARLAWNSETSPPLSRVLELQVCTTMPGFPLHFYMGSHGLTQVIRLMWELLYLLRHLQPSWIKTFPTSFNHCLLTIYDNIKGE